MSDIITDRLERLGPVLDPVDQHLREPGSRSRRKAPRPVSRRPEPEVADSDEPPHKLDDMA